jgi:hypothetical protein
MSVSDTNDNILMVLKFQFYDMIAVLYKVDPQRRYLDPRCFTVKQTVI